MIWHNATPQEVLLKFNVDSEKGLTQSAVEYRTKKYGKNVISNVKKPSFAKLFFSQLKSKVVIALLGIAILSFVLSLVYQNKDAYSPLLIVGIVLLNTVISALYIYKCNNSLEELNDIINPNATVLRDGVKKSVNSYLLVPGDIIFLEEGDYIPADARILCSHEFRCDESKLTGVEVPVEKYADRTFDDITPINERQNMVFWGTNVVHGSATAVVVATGLNTENGKTSKLIQDSGEDKLPLETGLDNLGKVTNIAIFMVCALIFGITIIQNFSTENFANMTVNMLLNTLAYAVAAIPEGLPAITTIVIAIGIQRILQDNIIIKDTKAAEILGRTDIICCDKTGVFTRNKMEVTHVFDGKNIVSLEIDNITENAASIIKIATACSTLENDSTESAIENACIKYNSMSTQDIKSIFPHISQIPFDSFRKTMTVITMINERPFAIVKGAPEMVLPYCNNCNVDSVLKVNEEFTNQALRVVCIAMRPLLEIPTNPQPEEVERDLTFLGLIALSDPPREGVVEQIKFCDEAGIKTVMITGDNLITAKTIARRIGILKDGTIAVTGAELAEMSDEELRRNIENISAFARVSPSDKLRIVRAWQYIGKTVTITGDGVQDAQALAAADVGCAIGKFGADVARGNADILISNNRFESIIRAIKESRGLFSNIRKSVSYLFSCNIAEILSVLFGVLIFKSAPVTAAQLLLINILTDFAPAISLSMESAEKGIMKSRNQGNLGGIFSIFGIFEIALQSIFIALVSLLAFVVGKNTGSIEIGYTMAFATISMAQLFHCFNRKFEGSVIGQKLFENKFMNYALGITFFITVFLVFSPIGAIFSLQILKFKQFILCFVLAFLVIPFAEIIKFSLNRFSK